MLDISGPQLVIPDWLDYRSGDYSHQGEAVDAWARKWGLGIMEMATGAGKTVAALVSATRLQKIASPLLVVITAPFKPLLMQWNDEVKTFGIKPVLLSEKSPAAREKLINEAIERLDSGQTHTEIIIVSITTFCSTDFQALIKSAQAEKMLVADECHNLGAPRFIKNPPLFFKYRLGLSATPIRQYDQDGTAALLKYFGDVCYSFPLAKAIGKCLCHYDYHIHWVEMTKREMALWKSWTDKIRTESGKLPQGKRSASLDFLCRNRHLLIEEAIGKMSCFKKALAAYADSELKYTLVYTTDKSPTQMKCVNAILEERNIKWNQLTYEETSKKKLAREILDAFKAGQIDVLTAKRVLDEGVNIPEIQLAFILASTSVKRQWIQRRGRLLRPCQANGKSRAVVHDFITVPYDALSGRNLDFDARKMVRAELERVTEFAYLASNYEAKDGPGESLRLLEQMME